MPWRAEDNGGGDQDAALEIERRDSYERAMNMRNYGLFVVLAAGLGLACGEPSAPRHDAATSDTAILDGESVQNDTDAASHDTRDTSPPPPLPCGEVAPTTPRGVARGSVPPPLEVPLHDGSLWRWAPDDGTCGSVVVLTDRAPVSARNPASLWDREADLEALLAQSPGDTRYLFVAARVEPAAAIAAMAARVAAVTARLPEWIGRVGVSARSSAELAEEGSWLGTALNGVFPTGLALDHGRRLRGVGSLADVRRYDPALAAAEAWPWENNLAYAAWEAVAMQAQEAQRVDLESRQHLVSIDVFSGETLAEAATAEVTVPAAFFDADRVTAELTLRCPDPAAPELGGNCGEWDYLAQLFVLLPTDGPDPAQVELARFITPYQREAAWVADVTPLLALIRPGEPLNLRWSFAPSWNPQPTATWLTLTAWSSGTAMRPTHIRHLWSGGDFGPAYAAAHPPQTVRIPATARKVELRSLITGHGSGPNQCAEFCNHLHSLSVGGATFHRGFLEAQSSDGCLKQVGAGVVPNQGGTWWFGRGGWCPGAVVTPWVIDITELVTPGADATVSYAATLGGRDPPEGSGNIELSIDLIVYE